MGGAAIFFLGWLVGTVSTAWIIQRVLNRQSVFPTKIRKAKVIQHTDLERSQHSREYDRKLNAKIAQQEIANKRARGSSVPARG